MLKFNNWTSSYFFFKLRMQCFPPSASQSSSSIANKPTLSGWTPLKKKKKKKKKLHFKITAKNIDLRSDAERGLVKRTMYELGASCGIMLNELSQVTTDCQFDSGCSINDQLLGAMCPVIIRLGLKVWLQWVGRSRSTNVYMRFSGVAKLRS